MLWSSVLASDIERGGKSMTDKAIDQNTSPVATDPADLPVERVGVEICRLAGQIASATSRFLRLLADFDAREGWAGANIKSCAQWLSWRCGIDLRTAREHVRVARALTELPKIRESFDAGQLSYSKVRAISRVATPTSENDLLDVALHSPAAHVERLTRGLRTAGRTSPPSEDHGGKPQPISASRRRITWHWDLDTGDLIVSGRLAPEDGARLLAAATRTSFELDRSSTGDPTASPSGPTGEKDDDATRPPASEAETKEGTTNGSAEPALPHDAGALTTQPPSNLGPSLVAMAEMTCTQLAAPVHAPAADVLVTVDIDSLVEAFAERSDPARSGSMTRSNGTARLDDGPALTAETLRRLADDGRFRFAVTGSDGRTIDLGRSRRTPNSAQLRALWRRDHGCAMPGCGRSRFLHAHHVVFWTNGGATDLDNLVLLCDEHHRTLYEGGFTITALGRQRFRFTGSDGTEFNPAPSMSGRADDLVAEHLDIEPDSIVPDWDGFPVRTFAISEYLTTWRQMIRRNQKHQEVAS